MNSELALSHHLQHVQLLLLLMVRVIMVMMAIMVVAITNLQAHLQVQLMIIIIAIFTPTNISFTQQLITAIVMITMLMVPHQIKPKLPIPIDHWKPQDTASCPLSWWWQVVVMGLRQLPGAVGYFRLHVQATEMATTDKDNDCFLVLSQ